MIVCRTSPRPLGLCPIATRKPGDPAAPRVMAHSRAKPIHTYSSFRRLSWVPFDSAPSQDPQKDLIHYSLNDQTNSRR